MIGRLRFILDRLRERLWVRPLVFCILSVAAAFAAKMVDGLGIGELVPEVAPESIETMLSIMSASMLVVATFAVGSMVSAYASASGAATPRSFSLVVSDDVSQNALSTFIGAFIFSIVALITMQNSYFDKAGHFALFVITAGVFAWVVLTFVRWVDQIARLGRLGGTIDKVESAAADALERRRCSPRLGGVPVDPSTESGIPVYGARIGYVQHIDIPALQSSAERFSVRITVNALPGAFAAPAKPLVFLSRTGPPASGFDESEITDAFEIGDDRVYEQDPRFGLIALSEIAARALSPAVNDPGTAIDIIGSFVRLFSLWSKPADGGDTRDGECTLVHVPELSIHDLFDDAFTVIARDGAGMIEVQLRLQKALVSLASVADGGLRDAAEQHSRLAVRRAEIAMSLAEDIEALEAAANWSA